MSAKKQLSDIFVKTKLDQIHRNENGTNNDSEKGKENDGAIIPQLFLPTLSSDSSSTPTSLTVRPLVAICERLFEGEQQTVLLQVNRTKNTNYDATKQSSYRKPETHNYTVSEIWFLPSDAINAPIEIEDDKDVWTARVQIAMNQFTSRFKQLTGVEFHSLSLTDNYYYPSSSSYFTARVLNVSTIDISQPSETLVDGIIWSKISPYNSKYSMYDTIELDKVNTLFKLKPFDYFTSESAAENQHPRAFPTEFPLPFVDGSDSENPNCCRRPLFLQEIALCKISAQLREKPNFHLKIKNPHIRHRWLREIRAQAPQLSLKAVYYLLQEIMWWGEQKEAAVNENRPFYTSSGIDGVWHSDDTVDENLLSQFIKALEPLENIPEEQRDYHPGSDNQVINLIHPSLYCLRIGKTHQTEQPFTLEETFTQGDGIVPQLDKTILNGFDGESLSADYAWLPSEFEIDENGKCKIRSYVNNLHPIQHAALYPLIEQMFERCVPLFERVLTQLEQPPEHRMNGPYYYAPKPHGDTMEERLALRIWSRLEKEMRNSTNKNDEENENTMNDTNDSDSSVTLPYFKYFKPSSVSSAKSKSIRTVNRQVHPEAIIDSSALQWMSTIIDGIAYITLHECMGVNAPANEEERQARRNGGEVNASGTAATTNNENDAKRTKLDVAPGTGCAIEPLFPSALQSHMKEVVKHARSEATKAVTKYENNTSGDDASLSERAGLVFNEKCVSEWYSTFQKSIEQMAAAEDSKAVEVQKRLPASLAPQEAVALLAMCEYLTAEYLELGGNAARSNHSYTTQSRHLQMAADGDEELTVLTDAIHGAIASASASSDIDESKHFDANTIPLTYGGELLPETKPKKSDDDDGKNDENEDKGSEDDGEDDGDEDDYDDGRGNLYQTDVTFPYPSPPPFDLLPPSQRLALKGRQLQVIVKIAEIALTPENSTYNGGSWHVEGMLNESIVASAIVYLSTDNITDSHLAFRHACTFEHPEQDDSRSGRESYGIDRDESLCQELGSIHTKAGRAVAFPNIFQHQVQPFKLIDPTKPGLRRILVFFLCDPSRRVTSTATVPPQQKEWMDDYFSHTIKPTITSHSSLIADTVDIALSYSTSNGTISRSEAEADRLKLMKERKYYVNENSAKLFERPYSFCEH